MNLLKRFAVIAALAVVVAPASAQFDNVGYIDFPTSVSGEAQEHFLRGVAILHSFGWEQAVEQFLQQVAHQLPAAGSSAGSPV